MRADDEAVVLDDESCTATVGMLSRSRHDAPSSVENITPRRCRVELPALLRIFADGV